MILPFLAGFVVSQFVRLNTMPTALTSSTMHGETGTINGVGVTKLDSGQALRIGGSVRSPNGRTNLTLQIDGNLVIYDMIGAGYSPLWASVTSSGAQAIMQSDGNFVVYDANQQPLWASATNQPGAFLAVQDDGNVVIYSPAGSPLWSSNTNGFQKNISSKGFDVGVFLSDAANGAGQVITHPADDVSQVTDEAIGALSSAPGAFLTVATHPADDLSAIVNVNIDDFVNTTKALPGFQFVTPDLQLFVDGPFRDFASSAVGNFLLFVFAGAMYDALVPALAPIMGSASMQAAAVAFAIPSFFQGTPFGQAWLKEFVNRLQQTIKILLGNAQFMNELEVSFPDIPSGADPSQWLPSQLTQKIIDETASAQQYLGKLNTDALQKLTYDQLSQQLSIRVDSAAAALAHMRDDPKELAQYAAMNFNPVDGSYIPPNIMSAASGIAKLSKFKPVAGATIQVAVTEGAILPSVTTVEIAGYEATGRKVVAASKTLRAASVLSSNSDYTTGYWIGTGMMQTQQTAANVAEIRAALVSSMQQTGFDAALASHRGALLGMPINGAPQQKAGNIITKGMQMALPTQIQNVMHVVKNNPSAAVGASDAITTVPLVASIPPKTPAQHLSWWRAMLNFFGL